MDAYSASVTGSSTRQAVGGIIAPRRWERLFHRSLYLAAQRARGRPVGKLMRQLLEWDSLDAEAYSGLSRSRLEQMLAFAAGRVPLYRLIGMIGA